jgi:hypothetical protein
MSELLSCMHVLIVVCVRPFIFYSLHVLPVSSPSRPGVLVFALFNVYVTMCFVISIEFIFKRKVLIEFCFLSFRIQLFVIAEAKRNIKYHCQEYSLPKETKNKRAKSCK